MSLPRKDRFLQENIILVGVIPGPKEPSLLMNSFLKPLVEEFKKLWTGVVLKNNDNRSIVVNRFVSPADIGRLPTKNIFRVCMSAEQWKKWTIFYSLFALKDVLPWEHFNS